ncbi:hypothetical protein [Oleiharenicola lentus]|uniref:hypothetical protein n=1 Tax=Oleiharenicola lentus TaxID=2508720 RepID=UPI003F663619
MMRLRPLLRSLALVTVLVAALASATRSSAGCVNLACVSASGRLANISTERSVLLNALLGGMLGTNASLDFIQWQHLADSHVNLLSLLQVIQTDFTLGTPVQALDATLTMAQIFDITARALQADGDTAGANVLSSLALQVQSLAGTYKLSDLLQVCVSCDNYADVNLNLLDFVSGNAALFNYRHLLHTQTPITISGAALGLGSVLGNIQLFLQILQPPRIICGPAGAVQFYGAAIRLKLNVDLVDVDLTSTLATQLNLDNINLGLLGGTALSAKLANLTLYVAIARVQGTIQAVDALANAVSVRAIPGLVDIYLGQFPDDDAFFTGTSINSAALTHANIGSLNVTVGVTVLGVPVSVPVTAEIGAKAHGVGASPFYTDMLFTGPYPQTQSTSSGTTFVTNLTTTLLSSLDLTITVTGPLAPIPVVQTAINLLLNTIKPSLVEVYKVALATPLNLILLSVVNPALGLLGIRIGIADITVLGMRRRCRNTLSGFGYRDANRNGLRDDGEAGTGLTLYAKLVLESAPTNPASQVVAIDPGTGAYSFTDVAAGTYRIVIDDNATDTDVTPATPPAGWIVTEQSTLVRTNVVANTDTPNLNFGFAAGTVVTGRVFRDSGTGAGTANDGVPNGTEAGSPGVTVQLRDGTNAILETVTTGENGGFSIFIPSTVTNGSGLKLVELNLPSQISTGAQVGTTGGSYDRATDTITFNFTTGTSYSGVNFGDVPMAQLTTDGQQSGAAGTTVYYPHEFIAGSAGTVTFSTTHEVSPATEGWTEIVFRDDNSNGILDSGESPVSPGLAITENQQIALIVKVTIPSTAPQGATNKTELKAEVTYTNANPALTQTITRNDVTTVGESSNSGLRLVKTVNKPTVLPGEVLNYTITFTNITTEPLANVRITDNTPTFTKAVSAGVGTIPTSLGTPTTVSPTAGATGAIRWTFTGTLDPGATGTVVFSVIVDQ